MKLIITFATFLISMSSMGQSLPYKALLKIYYDSEFPVIHPFQHEILEHATILDSREQEEYDVSHIKGAKWIGFDDFSMDNISGIPKDKPIVIYCSVGVRSQKIGIRLKEAGFQEVYNLYGGIFHWVMKEMQFTRLALKHLKSMPSAPCGGFGLKRAIRYILLNF